ncbi:hypothetical protein [Methylomonas sp. AM2-LC]|uniref:hypothetical protein n=1 Tax=Methylomonas sp. AM2-LC TaxID=3153301 RepID=UPI0032641BFE
MHTNTRFSKNFDVLKLICSINFNASLIILAVVSVISAMGSTLIFDDQTDLYGPMSGNLRLMLFYLCLTEVAVYSYCRFSGDYKGLLVLGVFLLLLTLSLEFYGSINQVPIDENYQWFFLYMGLSHLSYGRVSKVNII